MDKTYIVFKEDIDRMETHDLIVSINKLVALLKSRLAKKDEKASIDIIIDNLSFLGRRYYNEKKK